MVECGGLENRCGLWSPGVRIPLSLQKTFPRRQEGFFILNMIMEPTKIYFTGRKEICRNTFAFSFSLMDSRYEFKPGQYAHFTISNPAIPDKSGNSRPLSIASSPGNINSLMVAVRRNQSLFVENLLSLSPGDELSVSVPVGEVALHSNAEVENVFVAGGIGITPVRSIVEHATQNNLKNKITLFYANKSFSNAAFIDDFLEWSWVNDNFRLIPIFENEEDAELDYETGRIDQDKLKKHLGNFENKVFNLIGPPEMIFCVKEILLDENVSEENIKTEKFI